MQFLFRCLCYIFFPKLSEIRICHRANGLRVNPRNWKGAGGWFYLPHWPLSSRMKREEEDAEKGWRFVGFLAMNCHVWGRTEHPRSAWQSGARLRRGPQHMGLPGRDRQRLRAPTAPGDELRGGCASPGPG